VKRGLFLYCLLLTLLNVEAQEVYTVDRTHPVHDLSTHLLVFADHENVYNKEIIRIDTTLESTYANTLPKYLKVGTTYWGRINILVKDSIKGWTLNFEDKMIGTPAWSKSNGKVDVYAYFNDQLLLHKKTGVEYPKRERDIKPKWVLNRVGMDELPLNTPITLVIKVQGNSFGYPPYFNASLRSPAQPYYHQIYQFHNSFNIFMFGVTFIIFIYYLLQFLYLKQRVFLWFSIWLAFAMITHAMSVGLLIDDFTTYRYPFWMFFANGIFYSFWFFGREFINSKKKFPKLDKFMLGIALFILGEIVLTIIYVVVFKPQTYFTGVGVHYQILNIYTIASLVLAIILSLKKDPFARYFGIGALIMSIALIIGLLWTMSIIRPPIDPFATGIFLQIVIYSFAIAYRRQRQIQQVQIEKLQAQKNMAEMERIKDLDEIKTRFFANISHEFRTPLSLISGPLNQAKNNINLANENIEISPKAFGIITKNTHRLQNLIDQLLELSKIESGKVHLDLRQGGLIQFIKSIVYSFESLAETRNISLNTSFPKDINDAYYDRDKLEKIVSNLLSNAFKYTLEGGAVVVSVDHDNEYYIIEISDTGKGINKEELKLIFDRFYRVEGTEQKGSGIGLALTKEMVDLHNGQISVNSRKGKGTTFKVRIPFTMKLLPEKIAIVTSSNTVDISATPLELLKSNKELNNPSKNDLPVALIVDDNTDLRYFISDILKDQYKVLTAEDGLKGERMAFEHIPDIILSDVMMPKKDGYALCHSLKTNTKTSHIPIIMLTAKAGQDNKLEGLTQGVDAYITKPFNAQELLLRMKNLIETRRVLWDHFKSLDLAIINDLDVTSLDDKFLQNVAKVIKDNLDNEQLSVEDLARSVGFSRAQLHRKLKAITNKSANQLIVEIRLNEAKRMLLLKVATVSEVAYSVGYSNMSYFSKTFKEKFGVLPSKI
jgi:signal transduction histidine kinase/DNA-binding response OmpR family regulator